MAEIQLTAAFGSVPAPEQEAIRRLLTLAREHERRLLKMFGVKAVATLKSELRRIIEQGQHLLGAA